MRWADAVTGDENVCVHEVSRAVRAVDTGTFSQLECTILTCHLMNGFRTSIHKIPGPNSTTLGKAASRLDAIPRKIIVLNTGSWRSPCSTTKWANPTVVCPGRALRRTRDGLSPTVVSVVYNFRELTESQMMCRFWSAWKDSVRSGRSTHTSVALQKKTESLSSRAEQVAKNTPWIRPTQHRGRHTKNLVTERGKSLAHKGQDLSRNCQQLEWRHQGALHHKPLYAECHPWEPHAAWQHGTWLRCQTRHPLYWKQSPIDKQRVLATGDHVSG